MTFLIAAAAASPIDEALELHRAGLLDPEAARELAVDLRPSGEPSPDQRVLHAAMVVLGNGEPDRLAGNDQLLIEQLHELSEDWIAFSQDPDFASDPVYVTDVAGVAAFAVATQGAACPTLESDTCGPDPALDTLRHVLLATIAETVDRSVLAEPGAAGAGRGLEATLFQELLPGHPDQPVGTFVPVPYDDSDAALRYWLGRHHETRFRFSDTLSEDADLEAAQRHLDLATEHLEWTASTAESETLQAKALLHLAELHSAYPDALGSGGTTLVHMNLGVLRAAEALVYADALGQVEENRARHLLASRLIAVIEAEVLRREGYERALEYAEWLASLRDLREGGGLDVCAFERVGLYESGEPKDVRPRTASHWSHLPAERCRLQGKVHRDFAGFAEGALAAAELHDREEGTVTEQYQGELVDLANRTVEAVYNGLADERLSEDDRADLDYWLGELVVVMTELSPTGERIVPLEYKKPVEAIRRLQKELAGRPPFEVEPETGLEVGLEHPLPSPVAEIEDTVDGELLVARVTRRHLDAQDDIEALVYVPPWLSYTVDQIAWEARGEDLASPARSRTQLSQPLRDLDAALARFPGVEPVRAYVRGRGAQLGTSPLEEGELPEMGLLGFVVLSYDSESELDAYALAQDVSLGLDQPTTWGPIAAGAETPTERMLASLTAAAYRESLRKAPSGPRYGLWYARLDDHALAITLPGDGELLLRQNRGRSVALVLEQGSGSGALLQLQDNIVSKPWFRAHSM